MCGQAGQTEKERARVDRVLFCFPLPQTGQLPFEAGRLWRGLVHHRDGYGLAPRSPAFCLFIKIRGINFRFLGVMVKPTSLSWSVFLGGSIIRIDGAGADL